eukprot:NODE_325_length_10950_cov_0.271864.p1 type:complete len:920 gc:universal NODE_325_length_10950_cov_0.271864:7181-4422(-)
MQSLKLFVKIIDSVASVVVEQHFKNPSDTAMECNYKFPVNDNIAVTGFEANVNNELVIGRLVTKESAKQVYDDAMTQGNTAAVLHQTAADMFEMSLGRLPPNATATVRIQFVQDLTNEVDANNVRFSYPVTMVPRYIAFTSAGNIEENSVNPEFTTSASYKIELSMTLEMTSNINNIDAGSQELSKTISKKTATIVGSLKTTKDFSVIVECESIDDPVFYLEKYAGNPAIIDDEWVSVPSELKKSKDITNELLAKTDQKSLCDVALTPANSSCLSMFFVPQFKLKEIPSELIFLIDESGSMQGQPISLVRDAMSVFLKSIPENAYFNIIRFGSSHVSLFPASQKYSESTLKQAEMCTAALNADLGGTEIYQPLKFILNSTKINGYKRQLFILTDGSVSNADECLNVARQATTKTNYLERARIYTMGIGSGVSTALVNGLATAGQGTSEFVIEGERMEKKCIGLLKRALMPSIDDLSVEWVSSDTASKSKSSLAEKTGILSFFNKSAKLTADKIISRFVLPTQLLAIHPCKRVLLQVLLKENEELPTFVIIKGKTPDGPIELKVPIKPLEIKGKLMHSLALKRLYDEHSLLNTISPLVQSVFNTSNSDGFVTQSLLNFNISSKKTSWVLVFGSKVKGKMITSTVQMPVPQDRQQLYAPSPIQPLGNYQPQPMMSMAPPPAGYYQPQAMMSMAPPAAGNYQPQAMMSMAPPAGYYQPQPMMSMEAPQMQMCGLSLDSSACAEVNLPTEERASRKSKTSFIPSKKSAIPAPKAAKSLSKDYENSDFSQAPIQLEREVNVKEEDCDLDLRKPELSSTPKGAAELSLLDFLKYQKFNGLYDTEDEFVSIIGNKIYQNIGELKRALNVDLEDDIVVSIFALAYLNLKYQSQQEEWELSAKKTEKKILEIRKDFKALLDSALALIV